MKSPTESPNLPSNAFVSLLRDSSVYLIGSALLGLGNFVLVPLYTRSLRPAEFGVFALIDVTILILISFSQMKLDVSYLREYADAEHTRETLLATVFWAAAILSAISGVILLAIAHTARAQAFLGSDIRGFAWSLLPIVMTETLQAILLSDLRARRKAAQYCLSTLARLAGIVAASVWFIRAEHMGLAGVFYGRLAGDLLGMLVLGAFCLQNISPALDLSILKRMLRFGIPIVWGGIVTMALDATGRYFLAHQGSTESVGYLGAAVKISGIFQMLVTQPFGIAWGGMMFQIVHRPEAKMIYSKILAYVTSAALTVGFVLSVSAPFLFRLFAPSYAPAMSIFPLVVLMRAIQVLEYPSAIGIYLSGRTGLFPPIYTAALLVNLAANFILVPSFGLAGALYAALAGWVVVIAGMLVTSHRLYPLKYYPLITIFSVLPWCVYLAPGLRRSLMDISTGILMSSSMALAALAIFCTGALFDVRKLISRSYAIKSEV